MKIKKKYQKPVLIPFESEVVFGTCHSGPTGTGADCDPGGTPGGIETCLLTGQDATICAPGGNTTF